MLEGNVVGRRGGWREILASSRMHRARASFDPVTEGRVPSSIVSRTIRLRPSSFRPILRSTKRCVGMTAMRSLARYSVLSLSPSLQIPHKRYDEKSNSWLLCRTITHERMYKRSCHCTGGRTKTQSCMIYSIFKVRKMVANLYRESLNATLLTHPGSSE